MSEKRKQVENGRGTDLLLGGDNYFSVGRRGDNVALRCNGTTVWFESFEDLFNAIDLSKASYVFDKEGLRCKAPRFYPEV